MRIGELASRTEMPARLLRYYEDQGLLTPDRRVNGYRDYGPDDVPRVLQIRGLIDARIQCLARNRDAIIRYLATIQQAPQPPPKTSPARPRADQKPGRSFFSGTGETLSQ